MAITIEMTSEMDRFDLFGPADEYLKAIRGAFEVRISARGEAVTISGKKENVGRAQEAIEKLQGRLRDKGQLTIEDVQVVIDQARSRVSAQGDTRLYVYSSKGFVDPTTPGQKDYVKTMLTHGITFCVGPAGTGKTYLAVAVAVSMLKKKQIRKIVLARPAVEAGERLGFLPGDLQAKVNPYLRPLFDSIEDMMDFSQMRRFMDMDIIEIVPLAFMRGRTLNDSVIICDEAQNTSPSQMLMFLTRLGRGSRMIITGDITQIDLETDKTSGLNDAIATLAEIEGIGHCELSQADIVRHPLVTQVVRAYDQRKKMP